jgi:transposase-like protein
MGSYSSATRLGATLTRTGLHTKRLVLLAYRCPSCGSVKVLLNGTTFKTVSLASSTSGRVQIALPLFSLRTTTVTLKVATSGKLVRIDGLATSRV